MRRAREAGGAGGAGRRAGPGQALRRGALCVWAILGAALAGCGAGARPGLVDDAASMLARRQTTSLEARSPALIDEARLRLRLAESARARGDADEAAAQARQAIERYLEAVRVGARTEAACRDPDERPTAAASPVGQGLFLRLYNGDRVDARPSGLTLRDYDEPASPPRAPRPPADKQAPP